jgi:hypothetical protein
MSYICPVCGKHYASKADYYACMSEDYKKCADEAKEETNIDLKLHLYEQDILAAANKLKEQIARYNAYAREHDKPAYTGRIEITASTRKIAHSFYPSISKDPIKVNTIPDEPVKIKRECSCEKCSCGKKEEQKAKPSNEKKSMTMNEAYDLIEKIDINEFLDNVDDPNYWAKSGLLNACNTLTGFNVTKEDVERNINKALNNPLIQFQADMLRKCFESKFKKSETNLEELLNEVIGKEK